MEQLTLAAAAERFHTTEATLSRVETGDNRPSTELEDRIVEITGLTRDHIAKPRLARVAAEREKASRDEGASA